MCGVRTNLIYAFPSRRRWKTESLKDNIVRTSLTVLKVETQHRFKTYLTAQWQSLNKGNSEHVTCTTVTVFLIFLPKPIIPRSEEEL